MSCGLFSVFDPCVPLSGGESACRLLTVSPLIFAVSRQTFPIGSGVHLFFKGLVGLANLPNVSGGFLLSPLFWGVLTLNILGVVPFSFPLTTHPGVVLFVALCFWGGGNVSLANQSFESWVAHLLPNGVPFGMAVPLVLVESVSLLIQPFSLAIRLIANMSMGHALLNLFEEVLIPVGAPLSGVISSYEIFVSFIQAYVFAALLASYWSR